MFQKKNNSNRIFKSRELQAHDRDYMKEAHVIFIEINVYDRKELIRPLIKNPESKEKTQIKTSENFEVLKELKQLILLFSCALESLMTKFEFGLLYHEEQLCMNK